MQARGIAILFLAVSVVNVIAFYAFNFPFLTFLFFLPPITYRPRKKQEVVVSEYLYCPNCGTQVARRWHYCPNCSTRINNE